MNEEWLKIYNKYYTTMVAALRIFLESEDERMRALGADILNKNLIVLRECVMAEAQFQYYVEGSSFMSDQTYDCFERDLKLIKPDSPVLERVGYEIKKVT